MAKVAREVVERAGVNSRSSWSCWSPTRCRVTTYYYYTILREPDRPRGEGLKQITETARSRTEPLRGLVRVSTNWRRLPAT